jgi:hypothetical protein
VLYVIYYTIESTIDGEIDNVPRLSRALGFGDLPFYE